MCLPALEGPVTGFDEKIAGRKGFDMRILIPGSKARGTVFPATKRACAVWAKGRAANECCLAALAKGKKIVVGRGFASGAFKG